MEYRYTAIILKKKDLNETDRLYTFYTLESGKMQAIARGVRKPHAKLAGQLENFSLVSLMVMKSRGLGNIKSAVAEWSPKALKSSYNIMRNTFVASEKLNQFVEFEEPDTKIFHLLEVYTKLQEACAKSSNTHNSQLFLHAFLFQLMSFLGYTFETGACVVCAQKPSFDRLYVSYKQGGVVCADCSQNNKDVFRVSLELIKILRLLTKNNLSSFSKLVVTPNHLRQLEIFMRDYLRWTM